MLLHQKGKIRILCLLLRIFIAVSVHSDDPVRILIHHDAVWVHAERAHLILEFLRAVHDLALIELIRQMGEDDRRELHAHADVHAVGFRRDIQPPADLLHPLAPAAPHGDNAPAALIRPVLCDDPVSAVHPFHIVYMAVEPEIHLSLQLIKQIFQHDIIDIRPEMTHRCIQEFQLILHAQLLKLCARGRVHFRALAAVRYIDLIHIAHQLNGSILADILVQCAAEVIGNIIFPVREGARSSETAHDRAGLTSDAAFYFLPVDRTFSLLQRIPRLKYSHPDPGGFLHQLIRRKDPSRTCADDDHIISFHSLCPFPHFFS